MPYFQRNSNTVAQFHSYICNNATMQNIGLASYTRNSLENFGKTRRNGAWTYTPEMLEYFDGSPPTTEILGDNKTLKVMAFNKDTNEYVLKTNYGNDKDTNFFYTDSGNFNGNLASFQERFDLFQKGFITDGREHAILKLVWANIQNSLSGCITFEASFNVLGARVTNTPIQIYFHGAGKLRTERSVSEKGAPIITDIPKRYTGQPYSKQGSKNAPDGQFIGPSTGGANDPANAVAAQLQLVYNETTGKWESGTIQNILILLEDLDGVPSTSDLPDDPNELTVNQFLNGNQVRGWTRAYAMPMTPHNGNPNLFGPNGLSCPQDGGQQKIEKVLVINRSSASYKKGEMIMGNFIHGEWTPSPLTPPKTVSPKTGIEWSLIQKFMVNTHAYFANHDGTAYVTHTKAQDRLHQLFYKNYVEGRSRPEYILSAKLTLANASSLSDIPVVNSKSIDDYLSTVQFIKLSNDYLISYDNDLLDTRYGGFCPSGNLFKYTNVTADNLQKNIDFPNTIDADAGGFHWGLYSQDGYTSSSVAALRNLANGGGSPMVIPQEWKDRLDISSYLKPLILNVAAVNSIDSAVMTDPNLKHFPMQLALMSKTNPLFYNSRCDRSRSSIYNNNNPLEVRSSVVGDALANNQQGFYLPDFKGLKMVNPNSVQFNPLCLAMALHDVEFDTVKSTEGFFQGGYRDLMQALQFTFETAFGLGATFLNGGVNSIGIRDTILSTFWRRNNVEKSTQRSIISRLGFSDQSVNLSRKGYGFSFDPSNYPVGGPNLVPPNIGNQGQKEQSSIVGIVGAKATITLQNGGAIKFETDCHMGMSSYGLTTIAGAGFATTIIGAFIAFAQDLSGKNRDVTIKQWGSDDRLEALGNQGLYCKIYDHCPGAGYDARYFTPIQTIPLVVEQVSGVGVGATVTSTNYTTIGIEKIDYGHVLVTNGDFKFVQKAIGLNTLKVVNAGTTYTAGNIITFAGDYGAAKIKLLKSGPLSANLSDYEIMSSGSFKAANFKNGIQGVITKGEADTIGNSGIIQIDTGRVYQTLASTGIKNYGMHRLTPANDQGRGNNSGYVTGKTITKIPVDKNSTGKYDIFFFYTNDTLHVLDTDQYANRLALQHCKLNISVE